MKKTEEYLSQSKYAEHRNVTKGYIAKLIKEGRLHLINDKLNVKMCDAELNNKSANNNTPNYWSERALNEKAKRELAELDLKLKHDLRLIQMMGSCMSGMKRIQNGNLLANGTRN